MKKTFAIFDADGHVTMAEAHEIRMCAPTSKCIKFWAQTVACLIIIGLGTFFMIYQGSSSVYFLIGEALLALGVGVLIPSPKYSNVIPKRVETRNSVIPPPQESELEPTTRDERTELSDVTVDAQSS